MSRIIVQHVNNGVRCGRFMGLITDIGRICTLTNMCNHLFILVETHNVRLDLFQHKKYYHSFLFVILNPVTLLSFLYIFCLSVYCTIPRNDIYEEKEGQTIITMYLTSSDIKYSFNQWFYPRQNPSYLIIKEIIDYRQKQFPCYI